MQHLESALKRLAEGVFVCGVRYPEEYEALSDPAGAAKAQAWLEAIGYRLARLSDDGAFFMAYAVVTTELRAKIRDELKSVRNQLQPVVAFLETVRQAQGPDPRLQAGDQFWESAITEKVRESGMLERRLSEMRDISGARSGESAPERVRKLLVQLEDEGYLVETNPHHKMYQVTGKIDYLYQLMGVIAENAPHLSDDNVVDQLEAQADLLNGPAEGAAPT